MVVQLAFEAPTTGHFTPPRPLYRLLTAGELLQRRDAVYDPADDTWYAMSTATYADRIGCFYDPFMMGPVRRFNK